MLLMIWFPALIVTKAFSRARFGCLFRLRACVRLILLSLVMLFLSLSVQRGAWAKSWGLGVGYQNPSTSQLGVTVLYLADSWAFEAGVGSAGFWGNDDSAGLELGGDVDLKLLFGRDVRGYAHVGTQLGVGLSEDGGGFGLGSLFVGGGLLLVGSTLYGAFGADYILDGERFQGTGTLGILF